MTLGSMTTARGRTVAEIYHRSWQHLMKVAVILDESMVVQFLALSQGGLSAGRSVVPDGAPGWDH